MPSGFVLTFAEMFEYMDSGDWWDATCAVCDHSLQPTEFIITDTEGYLIHESCAT